LFAYFASDYNFRRTLTLLCTKVKVVEKVMTAKNAISSVIIISAATTINSLALSGDY
jgi:hypothetical protein